MEESLETVERLEGLRNRAAQYFRNSQEAAGKEEYEKAGERLWGAVANYIHAMILLRENKVYHRHGSVVGYGREIAKEKGDARLLKAVEEADEMHEHYHRGSRVPSTFPDRFRDVEYALEALDRTLGEEAERWAEVHRLSVRGVKYGASD